MTSSFIKKLAPLLLLALCLVPTAFSSADVLQLNAAGATFPYPIYSKWFDEFHKIHSNVTINYQSIGSGGGIRQLMAGTVDFGASDAPVNDEELAKFQIKPLHFPTVLGAVVPIYSLAGVNKPLNFTAEALAKIFLGTITKWNDPELAKANPGVKLPADEIVVVHRAEASGTSYVWTDYLSKVSSEWKDKVGKGAAVKWPVGLGGKGNEGVSGLIKQTPNSLGYVELIYAVQNKLSFGNVKNAAGKFVEASVAGVTAAAAGSAKEIPDDFRVSITNAPGAGSYPISSFTYLLIPSKVADAGKKKVMVDFLHWMLKDGQKSAEPLSYAPLPKAVAAKVEKAIALVQ